MCSEFSDTFVGKKEFWFGGQFRELESPKVWPMTEFRKYSFLAVKNMLDRLNFSSAFQRCFQNFHSSPLRWVRDGFTSHPRYILTPIKGSQGGKSPSRQLPFGSNSAYIRAKVMIGVSKWPHESPLFIHARKSGKKHGYTWFCDVFTEFCTKWQAKIRPF